MGTVVVSDWWEGLDYFFHPGQEILIAGNSEDVIEALNRDPDELRIIAISAQQRVLAEHTAAHRAAEFIDLIEASERLPDTIWFPIDGFHLAQDQVERSQSILGNVIHRASLSEDIECHGRVQIVENAADLVIERN